MGPSLVLNLTAAACTWEQSSRYVETWIGVRRCRRTFVLLKAAGQRLPFPSCNGKVKLASLAKPKSCVSLRARLWFIWTLLMHRHPRWTEKSAALIPNSALYMVQLTGNAIAHCLIADVVAGFLARSQLGLIRPDVISALLVVRSSGHSPGSPTLCSSMHVVQ